MSTRKEFSGNHLFSYSNNIDFIHPHPLLLPGIICESLNYLTDAQICISRLVCKTWNEEGISILRKRKSKINVLSEKTINYLMNQKPHIYPSLNIKIGNVFGKKHAIIRSFLKKCGSSIVCLQLENSSWSTLVSLRKILAVNTPNLESLVLNLIPPESKLQIPSWSSDNPAHEMYSLKKLQHLRFEIDYSKYWIVEEQDNIKPLLHHLLSGMPNLESITCPSYPENFIETFQYEVQILFRESPNLRPLLSLLTEPSELQLPKLKYLNMPLKFWTNIPQLTEKRYPLESLDWFIGLDVTKTQLQNLLSQVGNTLKNLSLDFTTSGKLLREVNFEPCKAIPCLLLQKLESLSLRSFKGSLGEILHIPQLKRLYLSKARDLNNFFDAESFGGATRNKTLEELRIDQYNPKDAIGPEVIERIGSTFVNLKILEARFLSNSSLRSIFKHCSGLTELAALDGIFTDAGVTGIPLWVLDILSSQKDNTDYTMKQLSKYREFPCITLLKQLKTLDLRSKHLTGDAVHFGLIGCKNLRNLTLMGYGFSSDSLCEIADKLNITYFKTIFCHQLTVEGLKYIREKLPHCELRLNELQKSLNGLDIYRLGLFQSGTIPIRKRISKQITSDSSEEENASASSIRCRKSPRLQKK